MPYTQRPYYFRECIVFATRSVWSQLHFCSFVKLLRKELTDETVKKDGKDIKADIELV